MDYYYTDDQNQPCGPVPLETLRQMLNSGELNERTQVVAVGAQQWMPIMQVMQLPAGGVTPVLHLPNAPVEPLSIWSLVCGLLGFFAICCPLPMFQLAAVVTGHLALSSYQKNPLLQGRGMAIGGLVLGYLGIALSILFWLLGSLASMFPQF